MRPRVRARARPLAALALPLALAAGCEGEPVCVEDPRAQVLAERVELTLGEHQIPAELADDPVERERGWMHRVCDRQALLMPLPQPGPLPIWGCALSSAIDAAWIVDGTIVALERIDPCPEPCAGCPLVNEALEVDAVVELELGIADPLALGDPVSW